MISTRVCAAILALALSGGAAAAQAQAQAQTRPPVQTLGPVPGVGAPVRDASGAALGRVEAVIADATGKPVQVVVRTRGMGGVRARSRAVPFDSLRPDGGGFVTPLRRAEFDLLPPVRR